MAAPLRAQQQTGGADWDNLKQVHPGEDVQIVLNDMKSYRGRFQSVNDEGIVIRLASGEQTFASKSVLRVSSARHGHFGLRKTLLGAAIGAGVGLGVGAGVDKANSCGNPQPSQTPTLAPLNPFFCGGHTVAEFLSSSGGVAGAMIGTLLPKGGWQEVSRAHLDKSPQTPVNTDATSTSGR